VVFAARSGTKTYKRNRLLGGNNYDPVKFGKYVKKSLEKIGSLGVKKVVFGSAKVRNIPSNIPAEEGKREIVDGLKFILEIS
jgi:hypothetical protein